MLPIIRRKWPDPSPVRFWKGRNGLALDGVSEGPQVKIGLPAEYPALKFALCKVVVVARTVKAEAEIDDILKEVIPIIVFARLYPSKLRLDKEERGDAYTLVGSAEQLANANGLLASVLGGRVLTHGTKVSYDDILQYDKCLNTDERAMLTSKGFGKAGVIFTPALYVDGVVFKGESHISLVLWICS